MSKQNQIVVKPGGELHSWVKQQADINRRSMGQEVANILDIYRASLAPLMTEPSKKVASLLAKTAPKTRETK
jgi:hypothetical protein